MGRLDDKSLVLLCVQQELDLLNASKAILVMAMG